MLRSCNKQFKKTWKNANDKINKNCHQEGYGKQKSGINTDILRSLKIKP